MYKIHVTKGVILECWPQAEVDAFYYVYTKDYGLIGVTATGVKLQKSKLRFSLQPFSLVEIGFVKGKSTLRVTHAVLIDRIDSTYEQRFFARLLIRLRRLVKGEDQNTELYTLLEDAFRFIRSSSEKSREVRFGIEAMFTMRLLEYLGYWGRELTDEPYLRAPIDDALSVEVYEKRDIFTYRIQKALEETQL